MMLSRSLSCCICFVGLWCCARTAGHTVVLTEADAGKVRVAALGDAVVLKLRVVPANGYLWRATAVGAGLVESSPTRFESDGKAGVPGNAELQTFSFLVMKRGLQELQVFYSRGTAITRHYVFKIDVK